MVADQNALRRTNCPRLCGKLSRSAADEFGNGRPRDDRLGCCWLTFLPADSHLLLEQAGDTTRSRQPDLVRHLADLLGLHSKLGVLLNAELVDLLDQRAGAIRLRRDHTQPPTERAALGREELLEAPRGAL